MTNRCNAYALTLECFNLIGRYVSACGGDMSPDEFKAARDSLGLSQKDLAEIFGISTDRTVRRWEEGERDIPGSVLVLMELCLNVPEVREYFDIG